MNIPTTAEVIKRLRDGQAPPLAAMRVASERVTLQAEGNGADAKSLKVNLKARQRGPISHWYFGKVWHDLSTMRSKEKIALDDTHDVEIGYGRPFQSEYGLEVNGVVIGNQENPDHASNRVLYNLKNGIPQEASIDFSGEYDVQDVPEGLAMPVNGQLATGPCLVIQNWALRACAICKEGADSSTTTEMMNQGCQLAPLPRTITTFSQPKGIAPMSEPISPPAVETPVEAAPATPPAVEAPPAVETQAQPEPEPEPQRDVLAELAAVAVELATTKTELIAAVAKSATLANEVAALNQRIATLSQGAAPVPVTVQPDLQTWGQALAAVKADHPQMAEWQLHTEAVKRFPDLLKKINSPKQ